MYCSDESCYCEPNTLPSCSGRSVLESQLQAYFKSESGHFPFERIYTCAESEQLHDWMTFQYSDGKTTFSHIWVSKFFLKSLHMHDCPYANITAAIINLYTAYGWRKAIKTKIQDFAVTLKKPLVNVCDGVDYGDHSRFLFENIARSDLIFLKVLVRYGVLNPDKSDSDKDLHNCYAMLQYYIESIAVSDVSRSTFAEKHARRIQYPLASIYARMQSYPELRNKYLRRQTVINVLNMLRLQRTFADTMAECIKLYFDATKECFVTVREIQELLDIPQQSLHLFNEQGMEEGYNLLRSVVPDCDILQPRSLQQLSRCAVRAHLTERGVLPQVVATLKIPDRIKQYILISQSGS